MTSLHLIRLWPAVKRGLLRRHYEDMMIATLHLIRLWSAPKSGVLRRYYADMMIATLQDHAYAAYAQAGEQDELPPMFTDLRNLPEPMLEENWEMESACLSGEPLRDAVVPKQSQVRPVAGPHADLHAMLHARILSPACRQGLGPWPSEATCGGIQPSARPAPRRRMAPHAALVLLAWSCCTVGKSALPESMPARRVQIS